MTEKAADELRPEPAASVLRTSAVKPPTCRPSAANSLIIPRTSDFGEPNSAGRTASCVVLASKGSKPTERIVTVSLPVASYLA